jgi:hypothetical protein
MTRERQDAINDIKGRLGELMTTATDAIKSNYNAEILALLNEQCDRISSNPSSEATTSWATRVGLQSIVAFFRGDKGASSSKFKSPMLNDE